jgi:hypothetical protein
MAPPRLSLPPAPRLAWPPFCPEPVNETNRIIGKNAIYDLSQVKQLVRQHGIFVLNDQTIRGANCQGPVALPPPTWSKQEMTGVILALEEENFENSQWCKLNSNRYLDCDSYKIYYSRSRACRWDNGAVKGLKLYAKFGFLTTTSIPGAILCRLHPSDY